MGPKRRAETSVKDYHSTQRNIPEEYISQSQMTRNKNDVGKHFAMEMLKMGLSDPQRVPAAALYKLQCVSIGFRTNCNTSVLVSVQIAIR
jgi:hypothetical protein